MAFSRYTNLSAVRYNAEEPYSLETPIFYNGNDLAQAIPFILIEYVEGTRLDVLANEYLGDGRYWWAICMMNNLNSPYDPTLSFGRTLRVPQDISDLVKYLKKG